MTRYLSLITLLPLLLSTGVRAQGIDQQTDLLKQNLVLVAVKLANQFDIIKAIYKQRLFNTPTTTVTVRDGSNIIDTITYGWAPADATCDTSNGTNIVNGFTSCLVNYPGDIYICPYDKRDHLVVEVRFKEDSSNPSTTKKRLLFVALDASGRAINRNDIGTVDGEYMGEIKFFTCINPDGLAANGSQFLNNGIRFGGVETGGVRLQLGRGYYNDMSPELSQCLTQYPSGAPIC